MNRFPFTKNTCQDASKMSLSKMSLMLPRKLLAKSAGLGMVLSALACGDKPNPTQSFAFNRPEHLEFVCIDPKGSDDASAELVLPLKCCESPTLLNPDDQERAGCKQNGSLHALVTQSTRGEVAAVDLKASKVLDSDVRFPGYTFVDVGGLPSAIVTPPHRPGNENVGPPWTYVTSVEGQTLRAVATCHFREGAQCGPEKNLLDDESDETLKDKLTKVLRAKPRDMLFLESDNALWLSLPDISSLARIALPTEAPSADGKDPPFAEGEIRYFPMPVVPGLEPAAPVEETEYFATCGLGYAVTAEALQQTKLALPASKSVPGRGVASPTRLRFDEESGLLLVADASQPLIHAFSVTVDGLLKSGSIATGAPIRDFALTPFVPSEVPPLVFLDEDGKGPKVPKFAAPENRYLYAIDDRDGSVMVQAFSYEEGALSSVPLRVPATLDRSDRLPLASAATALAIVDNRRFTAKNDGKGGTRDFVCDWGSDADEARDKKRIDKLKSAADAAKKKRDAAVAGAALDKAQAEYDQAVSDYTTADAERDLLDGAGAEQLRGVYVMITTIAGRLNVVDIHDLDVFCRGQKACDSATQLSGDADQAGLALRRHTLRVLQVDKDPREAISQGKGAAFETVVCEEGRYPAVRRGTDEGPAQSDDEDSGVDVGPTDGGVPDHDAPDASEPDAGMDPGPGKDEAPKTSKDDVIACTIANPWLAPSPAWTADWEGPVLTTGGGRLDGEDGAKAVTLYGPPGLDLCARGVMEAESDEQGTYAGDLVAFTGAPPSYAPARCKVPLRNEQTTLRVIEAYSDRLELGGRPDNLADTKADVAKVRECYPDLVQFEVRANERFLVTTNFETASGRTLHRLMAGPDGRCVVDPDKDPRFVSRANPGEKFVNILSSFTIAKTARQDPDAPLSASGQGAGRISYALAPGDEPSLPVSVQYLSITGEVYVVDAVQGLIRFVLAPEFRAANDSYR